MERVGSDYGDTHQMKYDGTLNVVVPRGARLRSFVISGFAPSFRVAALAWRPKRGAYRKRLGRNIELTKPLGLRANVRILLQPTPQRFWSPLAPPIHAASQAMLPGDISMVRNGRPPFPGATDDT